MTPYYAAYETAVTDGTALVVFISFDEFEAWCAGYRDGVADRCCARPATRRHEIEVAARLGAAR